MAPLLDAGDRINLTITFVVALAVSLVHAHHLSVTLKQHKQIVEINQKLQELAHQDPLTGLLNKAQWNVGRNRCSKSWDTLENPMG